MTATAAVTTSTGGALACPVTVQYATADGPATAGSDYTAVSGTLVFPTGTPSGSTQAIPVTLLHDPLDEADETFAVTLTGASGAVLGATPTHTVTIVDDDPAPTMAIGDVTVTEGASAATFTVTLSAASGQLVSVGYATANGTAVAGSDYTATSGVLTFEAGVVSQPIVVPLVNDTVAEATETFVVTLTNGVNVTLADAQAVSTILDDDQPLVFTDDPVQAGIAVRAVHLTELRTAIDGLRVTYNLPTVVWTDPVLTPGVTRVRALHLTELRTALAAVYVAAGLAPPSYTDDPVTAGLPIRAVHVNELRAAIRVLR